MKIGFTCGIFDLFHPGHVMMLKECKENCDHLIVALNKGDELPGGKSKPVFDIEERKIIVESSMYVDEVLVYNSETELLDIMKSKSIDIRFLGEDYKGKPITGSDLGIQLYYTKRDHNYSTSALIEKIKTI